jgi:hypothetical protein
MALREQHAALSKQVSLLNEQVRSLNNDIKKAEKERLAIEMQQFQDQNLITHERPVSAADVAKAADKMTKDDLAELLALLESELAAPAEVPSEMSIEELQEEESSQEVV